MEQIRALAAPIAKELGYDLWDVRFLKEGAEWYLRIFIDRPEGIGIDDCVAMSRAINDPLVKHEKNILPFWMEKF